MPTSLMALQILLILLPGFAAGYIVQFLATRRPQSDLERVIEALLFSFVIYVVYVWLNQGQMPFHLGLDPVSKTDTILWDRVQLAELAGITFISSLVLVAYLRFDGNRNRSSGKKKGETFWHGLGSKGMTVDSGGSVTASAGIYYVCRNVGRAKA